MTSPLPPFPATIQALLQKSESSPVTVEVDAATWLAGMTLVEVERAVKWREVVLPFHADDTVWAQPHLASLRPAWDQVKAQSVADGDPADVPVTLDLSGGPLMEWLHRNLFANFLQFALMHLDVDGVPARWIPMEQFVADIGGSKDVKMVVWATVGDDQMVTLDFDLIADAATALVRFYAATYPKIDVGAFSTLTPYLVGSTPQCEWMKADRVLAYRDAGFTSGEARAWEFGPTKDRPSSEMLRTLAALKN